jgi:ribonuclease P protein component
LSQTFPKSDRLSGIKSIETLFHQGVNGFVHPFKTVVHFHEEPSKSHLRLLISVPKRNFKKAVHRNRVKRLIREAWRRNKVDFQKTLTDNNIYVDVALIYTARTIPDYKELEPKIILILQRLTKKNEVHNTTSG